jgi:hypothetical protein
MIFVINCEYKIFKPKPCGNKNCSIIKIEIIMTLKLILLKELRIELIKRRL